MCEILALAVSEPRSFGDVLPWAAEVERLGIAGFGWGVAWTEPGGVRRYRSSRSLAEDSPGRDAVAGVRSDRFLVHLRRPSKLSTVQLADSQPFLDADEEDGVGWMAFCHNGYLERHADLRSRYEARLRGGADSEVGFEYFRERLMGGEDPARALADVHRRLGGTANLGYLGSDGSLLVYGGYPGNPLWRFEHGGATVAATALHSDDDSLFDSLFMGATGRMRVGQDVVAIEPDDIGSRAAS
jgi:hypothetical protein